MGVIETLFVQYGAWSWFVLGLVLLGLEILVPGTFFLWFGVSALIVGALTFFTSLAWQPATLIWLALAVVLLVIGRRYFRNDAAKSEDPVLNERGRRYVGRVFTLAEPIVANNGRLSIEDSIWRVAGPDLPAGTRVRVADVDGPILRVEAAG